MLLKKRKELTRNGARDGDGARAIGDFEHELRRRRAALNTDKSSSSLVNGLEAYRIRS
ncbi:MAG TPA: hypothetical protein PLL78_01355 [Fimbriimonadaceae bacterium]|nr:hypothetical protein [Fimbriimonadaceae bacterium]HRJ95307.1 hypothetical protein [Fimbriimonadaceae bacterium]